MSTGLRSWIVPCLCLFATLSGCAQSGPLISQRTSMGTLKTSLSHMEYENQQLRREVASLKAETRQVEDRLVQEESVNGELSARLDDARTLLSRRSLGAGDEADSSTLDPGPGTSGRTLPAGRSNKKRRKPPFAQIPGRIDSLPPVDEPRNDRDAWDTPIDRDNLGPQSRRDDKTLWLPVASGATAPSLQRR
jgi:hypothetical protein